MSKNLSNHLHPYKNLPKRQYWKQDKNEEIDKLEAIYLPKFKINSKNLIATAGSCFAQHVSKYLRQSDIEFLDFEPPPKNLPESDHINFGFSMYSARYGNIYTVKQLLQLAKEAFNPKSLKTEIWYNKNNMIIDPSRPTIEPNGYLNEDEFFEQRQYHLKKVSKLFSEMEIMVFTLGLTEHWYNVEHDKVYPLAPGVVGGNFDMRKHKFKNSTVEEIVLGFKEFMNLIAANNSKNPYYILTVSPVPLAATYEKKHVMTATFYSKSVLRNAAEILSKEYSNIDYFPSYEIVVNPWNETKSFDPMNDRVVKDEIVKKVMNLFFKSHKIECNLLKTIQTNKSSLLSNKKTGQSINQKRNPKCEEEILSSFK